mgnify:CR=1 FL=1
MLAFAVSCGDQGASDTTIKKEVNLAEIATPTTLTVRIEGMTCAMGCAKAIEKSLLGIEGVVAGSVDFEGQEGTFGFDASTVEAKDLIAAIEKVNDGAYSVTKHAVSEGIETGTEESSETDVEAFHSEKKKDEASV